MEKGIRDLLIDELHDILSAEEQIIAALPKMVAAAFSPDLKEAFAHHLKETKGQVQRLNQVFKLLKVERKEKLCKAARGLIEECKEVLKEFKEKSLLRDMALISKAQRIEHYEMAAYGSMRAFAKEIYLDDVAKLLQETLDEEGNANKALSKIAQGGLIKTGINRKEGVKEEKARDAKERKATLKKASIKVKKSPTLGEQAKAVRKTISKTAGAVTKNITETAGAVTKNISATAKTAKKSIQKMLTPVLGTAQSKPAPKKRAAAKPVTKKAAVKKGPAKKTVAKTGKKKAVSKVAKKK